MNASHDRSRTLAKLPASTIAGDFVPLASMARAAGLCPDAVEVLAQHGITAGIRAGILSVERKYAPAASAVLNQLQAAK